MGDPIQPASDPAAPSYPEYRFGLSAFAGGGFALRNDGNQTAVGPLIEVGLGPTLRVGPNRYFLGLTADFIRLNNPLFSRSEPDWVKTFGVKIAYGREVIPEWLTLKGQMGLGLAVYGQYFREDIQDGIYVREHAAGAHMALGAGACFWKERFCATADFTHDFRALITRRSDLGSDVPNLSTKTYDTNGMNLSLLMDIARFF